MIIDAHHHYLPKAFFDREDDVLPANMEAVRTDGSVVYRRKDTKQVVTPPMDPTWWWDEDKQLGAMDAAGIDHAVVSVACYQDWMTPEAAKLINDGVADLVSRRSDRFSGMISVVPDGGEEMLTELDRARGLGLCAVNLTTTHQGRYPDDPAFAELFEAVADRKLPVFVHPSWQTPLPNMERFSLERTIGKPTDLNIGLANLMFGGAFQKLPDLRVMFAHVGGSLPVTLRRLFYGQKGYTDIPDYDYPTLLERLFVDTAPGMWWDPDDIGSAVPIIGASQMIMGSDYPLSNDPAQVMQLAVRNVRDAVMSDEDRRKIFADNAIEFFGLHEVVRSTT